MWNNWQQLGSVAHQPGIAGMTNVLSNLLGTCIARIQCARTYFACTKIFFNLSTQATINVFKARPQIRFAIFFLVNKKNSFLEPWPRYLYFSKRRKQRFQDVIGDVCCPNCPTENYVYVSANKNSSLYGCKKCKDCSHGLKIEDPKSIIMFGGNGTHCIAKKTSRHYENEKLSPFLKKFITIRDIRYWNKKGKN